jgi:hypothetical protein
MFYIGCREAFLCIDLTVSTRFIETTCLEDRDLVMMRLFEMLQSEQDDALTRTVMSFLMIDVDNTLAFCRRTYETLVRCPVELGQQVMLLKPTEVIRDGVKTARTDLKCGEPYIVTGILGDHVSVGFGKDLVPIEKTDVVPHNLDMLRVIKLVLAKMGLTRSLWYTDLLARLHEFHEADPEDKDHPRVLLLKGLAAYGLKINHYALLRGVHLAQGAGDRDAEGLFHYVIAATTGDQSHLDLALSLAYPDKLHLKTRAPTKLELNLLFIELFFYAPPV